jgi:hypothetical protein
MSSVIAKMLTESTGSHFLDSGSAYGRHWQRNQGRKFKAEPAATVDFKYGIDVTLNVYHWLADRLTLSKSMDQKFRRFCAKPEHADESYFALVGLWLEHLSKGENKPRGLYGEGAPMTVNTYNGEDLLSQTIQYTYFVLDFQAYVVMSIHNGCDVRGGYTRPRVFEVSGEETSIFDNARATIYCTGDRDECGAYWDTDDGCHWYREGSCGLGAGTQLEAYDRTEQEKGEEWTEGKLHVQSDRSALCPCCGKPLAASATPGG